MTDPLRDDADHTHTGVCFICGIELPRDAALDRSGPAAGLRPYGVWTPDGEVDATVLEYSRPILVRATEEGREYVVISGIGWVWMPLAATPTASPTAGGLDVERLDAAIHATHPGITFRSMTDAEADRALAEAIANEYAALQSEATATGEDR